MLRLRERVLGKGGHLGQECECKGKLSHAAAICISHLTTRRCV